MGHQNHGSLILFQRLLQRLLCQIIQVVGRLVKDQQVRGLKRQPAQLDLGLSPPLKVERLCPAFLLSIPHPARCLLASFSVS